MRRLLHLNEVYAKKVGVYVPTMTPEIVTQPKENDVIQTTPLY